MKKADTLVEPEELDGAWRVFLSSCSYLSSTTTMTTEETTKDQLRSITSGGCHSTKRMSSPTDFSDASLSGVAPLFGAGFYR